MNSTRRLDVKNTQHHPRYVVWELTLRCDQLCAHCGSRAGDARAVELSLAEALDVVQELKEMGTKDIVLIGGEAYLHDGFLEILRACKAAGMTTNMTTGGKGVTPKLAKEMKAAGLDVVSVSIDGLEVSHDLIRANKGSYTAALAALDAVREAGIAVAANTNFNRVNRDDAEELYATLIEKGVKSWQIQITTPLGRAADRPDMILQPYDLIELLPRLASIKQSAYRHGMLIMPGNNMGYFGQEETLLRSMKEGDQDHWQGCNAGKYVMGIESDGALKGCPSLQTNAYVGGRIGTQGDSDSIAEIWHNSKELSIIRERSVDDLWGYCRSCIFAESCMGGCSFTAHAVLGRPGNNPYCHFRASSFAKEGKRERLIPKTAAPGTPFDNGEFDIVIEDFFADENWKVLELEEINDANNVIGSDNDITMLRREKIKKKKKAKLMQKHYF